MKQSTVIIMVLSAFALLALNLIGFSYIQELIRDKSDISVLIGIILIPSIILFDYLSIVKLYKFSKK